MQDRNAAAAYRRALAKRGETVILQRISGQAPNVFTFSAEVTALVENVMDDRSAVARTGYEMSEPGAITQSGRFFIVMADDLAKKRFPLPLQKNDRIVIKATSERLNIERVDAGKRRVAGAIELFASGV